jgi:hypothetical protein
MWHELARLGWAMWGETGYATATLISARRVYRLSLLGSLNPDMAMPEMARLGRAMKGLASSGEAGAAMGSREGGATRLFPLDQPL